MERKAAIYLRVSTTDQNYERQRDELEATVKYEGYRLVKVYEEKNRLFLIWILEKN
ncbi:recombinase family protein [Bacteroides sp. BFG-257]|uniref:recombinase family protein n=1 Tax=Bacteroides sp. BFG-257 TaxID=2972761 RepID=UPI002162C79B|nr:recombinase family protein [Bacteroides sp. BFG-257]UVO96248.1 recombinase family protein [Bacteroides sp. BFG-257]